MKLDDYQNQAVETAIFKNEFYPIASLMVEAAELADLFVKPMLRGDNTTDGFRSKVVSEAGDVLWNLAVLLRQCGVSLSEVAEINLKKLEDRKLRGVLLGSGGDR